MGCFSALDLVDLRARFRGLNKSISIENHPLSFEVCVLAGGASRRMGQDKAKMSLAGKRLDAWVMDIGVRAGLPVRLIDRDNRPSCGPLSGIASALSTTRYQAVLFLAVDMPFVTPALLFGLCERWQAGQEGIFLERLGRVGFPFLLLSSVLPQVEKAIAQKRLSLNELSRELKVGKVPFEDSQTSMNLNTQDDFERAARLIALEERA